MNTISILQQTREVYYVLVHAAFRGGKVVSIWKLFALRGSILCYI